MTDQRVVAPKDLAELVSQVRACAEQRTPISVCSGEETAAASDPAALRLSLRNLAAIDVDGDSMTLRAEAGATAAAIRAAAEKAKFGITGLDAAVDSRVGALVARGDVPRRSLCGLDVLLPSGDLVHAGGRILKDVAGYDLPAIMLGSMGRFAVVVAATFRLEPLGAGLPTAGARGEGSLRVGPDLALAFDPLALMRPGQ